MYKYLQKLGKSLMLPVAVLPICGILMGLGYAIAPGVMGVPGAPTTGALYTIGFVLVKAGGALIDNMPWLFVIGVAVGMSDDKDGTSALAGLVSFLMMKSLLDPAVVTTIMPSVADDQIKLLAFEKFVNVFPAIIAGIIGAACYNKFKNTRMPDWLAFFSGKRCVAIVTGVVSILVSVVLLFVWPIIFGVLVAVGNGIKGMGIVGVGLYTFLNRLLIPTGLHHALNNVFWFDTIGIGDLTAYWNPMGEVAQNADWSIGMYMAGFFPCMMFGVPGAALGVCLAARNKKTALGIVLSAAICAFICGVTEPFEFAFMFVAFPLYLVYSLLYGIFAAVAVGLGFRAGFMFSGGAADLFFSSSLPSAQNTLLIIPLGIAAFAVFFAVFYFAIKKFSFATPGNEPDDMEDSVPAAKSSGKSNADAAAIAAGVLAAVGGKGNVAAVDYCTTRLRFEVRDAAAVDDKAAKAAGAAGIIRPSKNACQVIIGPKVQFVYDELKKLL